jgi:hypothetical protein
VNHGHLPCVDRRRRLQEVVPRAVGDREYEVGIGCKEPNVGFEAIDKGAAFEELRMDVRNHVLQHRGEPDATFTFQRAQHRVVVTAPVLAGEQQHVAGGGLRERAAAQRPIAG